VAQTNPSTRRLFHTKEKKFKDVVTYDHILIDGAEIVDNSKKINPELDLFKDKNMTANSPQQLKKDFYDIRKVLVDVNTSFRFADGSDPDRTKVEFQELAMTYNAAAA